MFSIIIPYYNMGDFLSKTLESLSLQTRQLFEVIIVDDGSSIPLQLNTSDYIFSVKVVRTPNQGVSVARNVGASLAEYEWLIFLDAGDYYDAEFIAVIRESILKKPEIDFHASAFSFGENGEMKIASTGLVHCNVIFDYKSYLEHLCEGNFLFHVCSIALRKKLFFLSGGFSPKATHGEDHEFILKVLKISGDFMFINKPLFIYSLDDMNSATRKQKANPVYTHTYYLKNLPKRIDIENTYLINTVVDNLVVNLKKGFFIDGMLNVYYGLPFVSYGHFILLLFRKMVKYARK
ncbi:glycosyltransferase family A protein [Aeromonas veronii]|uniref:glycosyltransferase family 2 protein n=1 Tax=Aeromonas veronii TaxID=654 RepID=UPI003006FDC0